MLMTKKTKKEKILAELRRELKNKTNISSDFVKTQIQTKPKLTTPTENSETKNAFLSFTKPKPHEELESYSYVKHDLIRITIFTFFSFIFQGVLYFLLRTR